MSDNELNELALLVYLLSGVDVTPEWNRMLLDEMPSINQEQIMELWQQLLHLDDNSFLSVFFQFIPNQRGAIKTKVLLFTKEDTQLLVCNGIGSSNLINVSLDRMVDLLDWWLNLPNCDIPLLGQTHPVYKEVFRCSANVKSIHLFTNTHAIQENTNLRLAHFHLICEAAKRKTSASLPQTTSL